MRCKHLKKKKKKKRFFPGGGDVFDIALLCFETFLVCVVCARDDRK